MTNDFVFINYPKTGSTFVRYILDYIHAIEENGKPKYSFKNYKRIDHKNIRAINRTDLTPHGVLSQIPISHINKPIISIERNIFDRLISLYEYGFWKKNPSFPMLEILDLYPDFPKLSFPKYLDYIYDFLPYRSDNRFSYLPDYGLLSIDFIMFFSSLDPVKELNSWDTGAEENFFKSLKEIQFIDFSKLRSELYATLINFGYDSQDLKVILNSDPINISHNRCPNRSYFNDSLIKKIKKREYIVLEAFNKYLNNVNY